ncbi:MAG TPA: hypothetical protein VFL29_10860 [Candidatus Dormibacteraeota bacterium]|nr:hypothetical protein [Candidatus Dormibacteraeota bacterium]
MAGASEWPLLLGPCEGLLELAPALAFAWLAELFDELVLIDWPPPLWVWSPPEEEAAGWLAWCCALELWLEL